MIFALIAASGKGKRLGVPGGKQFVPVLGKPLLYHTLKAFVECAAVDVIVPVINREDEDRLRHTIGMLPGGEAAKKIAGWTFGGRERYESVFCGLEYLESQYGSTFLEGAVLIHDGARPLVSSRLIERVIEALNECDAVVPGVAVADTLKVVEGGKVKETLDRSTIRAVQTPQGFRGRLIIGCYRQLPALSGVFTDDAAVVEAVGHEVMVIDGDPLNIKVTIKHDLEFVEGVLKRWQE